MDTQGDILPGDTYSGLTFYDRGPGGMILGCHNYSGTSYSGFSSGGWLGTGLSPCTADLNPSSAKMPGSLVWGSNPYISFTGQPRIGAGGTLGMYRPDGFTDGFDTIQGARCFDSTSGLWTTPDADPRNIFNPMSLKSYIWNDNSPLGYVDPTGNDALLLGFFVAVQNAAVGTIYHTFGALVDNNGNILQIYSFGPVNGQIGSLPTLNNEYNDYFYAGRITQGGLYANSLYVAAGCTGTCAWEGALNKFYFAYRNNFWPYLGVANSNTALSWILRQAGLPTGLPAWAPNNLGWIPGGNTCSGTAPGSAQWGCTDYSGHFIASNPSWLNLGPGLSNAVYAIYGGAFPTTVDVTCGGNWTCVMQY